MGGVVVSVRGCQSLNGVSVSKLRNAFVTIE